MSQYHLAVLTLGWIDLILDGKKQSNPVSRKSDAHLTAKSLKATPFILRRAEVPSKGIPRC